jgi:RNA polymerase sigma factor (sigma-70 family)
MSSTDDVREELENLLRVANSGDVGARQLLFDKYAHHFRKVVRRRMQPELRALFDSDDFLQEARIALWKEINDKLFATPVAFLAYMSGVARNIVAEFNRKYLELQKHDLRKQAPLPDFSRGDMDPATPEPGPYETAASADEFSTLPGKHRADFREAVMLVRAGYSLQEVADKMHVDTKTLRVFLRSLGNQVRRN